MSAKRADPAVALAAAGYEVSWRGSVIRARKFRDDAWSYTLTLTAAGALRFSATRITQPGEAVTERQGKRTYRVTREQHRVTTILCDVGASDDLTQLLADLERIEQRIAA